MTYQNKSEHTFSPFLPLLLSLTFCSTTSLHSFSYNNFINNNNNDEEDDNKLRELRVHTEGAGKKSLSYKKSASSNKATFIIIIFLSILSGQSMTIHNTYTKKNLSTQIKK